MERRVDESNDDRITVHGPEESCEVLALVRKEGEGQFLSLFLIIREDHALHDREPLLLEEHVLGAAEADSSGSVGTGTLRIRGVVGIGPHIELAPIISPSEEFREPGIVDVRDLRLHHADEHLTGGSVDGEPVSFVDNDIADAHRPLLEIDVEFGCTDNGRLSELTSNESGVARPSAPRGNDSVGSEHAVHVVRLRLGPAQYHIFAVLRPCFSEIGIECDHAHSGTGRDVESQSDLPIACDGRLFRFGVELWVEEEVHVIW